MTTKDLRYLFLDAQEWEESPKLYALPEKNLLLALLLRAIYDYQGAGDQADRRSARRFFESWRWHYGSFRYVAEHLSENPDKFRRTVLAFLDSGVRLNPRVQ